MWLIQMNGLEAALQHFSLDTFLLWCILERNSLNKLLLGIQIKLLVLLFEPVLSSAREYNGMNLD